MNPRKKRRLVLIGIFGFAALGLSAWWFWRVPAGPGSEDVEAEPPDRPTALTLAFGRKIAAQLDLGAGTQGHKVLWAGNDVWVFATVGYEKVVSLRWQGSEWSEPEAVSSSDWSHVDNVNAAMDPAGRPVVFWTGFLGGPGEKLGCAHWTPDGWQPKGPLAGKLYFSEIASCVDRNGNVHVAYDGPLTPRERYSLGIVVVDGAYADKCHHLVFDGQRWTPPRATTGRGRFSVKDLHLSTGPTGTVYLSATLSPFDRISYGKSYLAYQTWDGTQWSGFRRVTPKGVDVEEGRLVVDAWGTKHVWWQTEICPSYAMLRNGTTSVPRPVSGWHVSQSVVADGAGRAVICWGDGLRIWNGRQWSDPLAPVSGQLDATAGGATFLTWQDANRIVLQEVVVRPRPRGRDGGSK